MRTRRRVRNGQGGFTLVEMLVSMTIFLMVSAIVSTVIISANRSLTKENGFVDAQAQTRLAFQRLDTQIRYASSVYDPTIGGDGSQWIDWESPDPTLAAPGLRCYQWKYAGAAGTLQYRTWVVPTSGGTVPTPAWTATFTGLVAGTIPVFTTSPGALYAAPYSLPSPAASASAAAGSNVVPSTPQETQVGVTLTVKANSPTGTSSTSTVFTALNAIGQPASPACSAYVARS